MPDSAIACPKCKRPMQEGFLPDSTYGGWRAPFWVSGKAERSVWRGLKLRGRTQLPVAAHRCPSCGYLELYAK
jgi:hypothetical protein